MIIPETRQPISCTGLCPEHQGNPWPTRIIQTIGRSLAKLAKIPAIDSIPPPILSMAEHDDEILAQAFTLISGSIAQQEEAVRLMDHRFGRLLERYFIRHKVLPDDAEELVWDVWLKILHSTFRGETRPVIWMWTIARSILISHHRKTRPELGFDDEDWTALLETRSSHRVPEWVRLCIERALCAFEADHPERSEILRMVAEEWSAQEVGTVFGCAEGAARDRMFRARKLVRDYLEECREEA